MPRHLQSPAQPPRWTAAYSQFPPERSSGPLSSSAPHAWLRPPQPGRDLYSPMRLRPQSRSRPQSWRLLSPISHPVIVEGAPLSTAGVVNVEEAALGHGDVRSLARSGVAGAFPCPLRAASSSPRKPDPRPHCCSIRLRPHPPADSISSRVPPMRPSTLYRPASSSQSLTPAPLTHACTKRGTWHCTASRPKPGLPLPPPRSGARSRLSQGALSVTRSAVPDRAGGTPGAVKARAQCLPRFTRIIPAWPATVSPQSMPRRHVSSQHHLPPCLLFA